MSNLRIDHHLVPSTFREIAITGHHNGGFVKSPGFLEPIGFSPRRHLATSNERTTEMTNISNARIAILATDGFEKSELFEPRKQLVDAGADITIVSLESGSIKSWDETDWGESIDVDITLDDASEDDFDALVLPGGQINPDLLRVEKNAVDFVKAFFDAGKPIAAICHAPWLLIEADLVQGHKVTGYKSIKTDLINAGGLYEDSEVVVDNGLITSRNPDDLDAFSAKIIEEVKEGIHDRMQEAA